MLLCVGECFYHFHHANTPTSDCHIRNQMFTGSYTCKFNEKECVSGFEGPDLVTVTLNTFSLFSQGSLSFIMKQHSKIYPLKITFYHQQGRQINVCVCVCPTTTRTMDFNDYNNLTVRVEGVTCHLQVLTSLSHQLIFSPSMKVDNRAWEKKGSAFA